MNRIGPIQLFAEIKRRDDRATYRGFDKESRQVVLVKIFTPTSIPDEAALARFREEAAIYASLNHSNVVKLVKFGVAENRPYLALEFIEGQNLRALMNQRTPLPNDVALGITLSLLAGLAEIHRLGVIHRDLKPENIMIGRDGSVKVCDFDLALNRNESTASQLALLSGSPGYFSPEAILGEAITLRSDLFALGVILYEMFAGTRPFAAPTASGEMNAVIRLPHLPPAKFNNTIPPAIEQIINRLLAKSPPDRPAAAEEIYHQIVAQFQIPAAAQKAQTLQRYLNDPSSYQSAEIVLTPALPMKPAPPRSGMAGRMIGAVALLGLVVLSYNLFTGPNQQQPATPNSQSAQKTTSLSRADSILRVIERISALDNSPPRPEGFKVEDTKTARPPVVETMMKPSAQPFIKNIVVRNFPWAYLFVNGDSIGQMPRAEPLALSAGVYQFVFRKPQFPTLLFKVVVDSVTADTLSFSLLERVAQVEVKIHPWAEMYLNGVRQEASVKSQTFYLLPGEHYFRFVHPQSGEKNEAVFLRAGEVRRLEVNMFRQTTAK